MQRYRADWVLPIADEALPDGWVAVDRGRIVELGAGAAADAIDLGRVAVLPALVNAHTHLELSYLQGRIAPAKRFGDWVRTVMSTRRQYPDPADPEITEAARLAIREAVAAGTAVFGDVSNTLVTVDLLRAADVAAHVFYELLGFTEPDPESRVREARARADAAAGGGAASDRKRSSDVRISLAAHAPYSVSAALFQSIRADVDACADTSGAISTVHLGETPEEVELLRHGTGDIRAVLEEVGRWPADWHPPGVAPVAYLADLGVLDSRMLVVHGVQFDGDDLSRLAALGVTIVSCPRSNEYVGVGAPPLEAFYAMDVDVAFGTDSLASAPDLNVFAELAEAHRLAPRVPPRRLLESATLCGARALRFERDFGSIEPGKRARLIAVRIPDGIADVEEYLVSGIEPAAITWLGA